VFRSLLVFLLMSAACAPVLGQRDKTTQPFSDDSRPFVVFEAAEKQAYGFDDYRYKEWQGEYAQWAGPQASNYFIPYKSVAAGQTDIVSARLYNGEGLDPDSVVFRDAGNGRTFAAFRSGPETYAIRLPAGEKTYNLSAFYKETELGRMTVKSYSVKVEKVVIVPLGRLAFDQDSIRARVNAIFRPAMLQLDIRFDPVFSHKEIDTGLFDNPGSQFDRYTGQMREVRDLYFARHPDAENDAFYLFVVPGFVSEDVRGYMVKNKSVGFVVAGEEKWFPRIIARTLSRGIGLLDDSWENRGPKKGSTDNLMDRSRGVHLRHLQWEELQHGSHSYSRFDNYEDVKTNNGMVAYYFWRERPDGTIILDRGNLLLSLRRPYKKNYVSYHLNITNVIYRTIFRLGGKPFCSLHLAGILGILAAVWYYRRKVNRIIRVRFRRSRLLRFVLRIFFMLLAIVSGWMWILLVDTGYGFYEVKGGQVMELRGLNMEQAVRTLGNNYNKKTPSEDGLRSELMIRRGSSWEMEVLKPVLYFHVTQNKQGDWTEVRLAGSSDSLVVSSKNVRERAQSHYIVVSYIDSAGKTGDQLVYNHRGSDITEKLKLRDPAKRILLFVNGYRPTSAGHTFEENFADIQKRGLEFPDSRNIVYDFDRYDYWRPWQAIDVLFKKRINPGETYYADGHFSVTTSNHRSLLNFSTISSIYPHRCRSSKKHTCFYQRSVTSGFLGIAKTKTIRLLRTEPNYDGFETRRRNGRIAGRNVLQMLNELPNRSDNDTVYIVAHSMGYAYALGMVDELRTHVHFGDFYILAPENASAGFVTPEEWQNVWQYGSNFDDKMRDAPCLQDGVAPQSKAGGLKQSNRVFIPYSNYDRKGFFDSHFIGYYTWIFDIPKGRAGYVTQR
jgi:hypothetical protein